MIQSLVRDGRLKTVDSTNATMQTDSTDFILNVAARRRRFAAETRERPVPH